MLKKRFLFPLFLILMATSAQAAANRFIPFQARLTDGDGAALNGVYKLIFIIYDEPTGGTAMWSEEHQDVSVINGMVNVILGTKINLDDPKGDGSNQSVYFTDNRYLGITVGTNSNQEMVPRHQIVPSFQSKIADRAFSADRALEANNADRLNNQLPEFYATKTSVDEIRLAVPPGTVHTYAGSTLPAGFLECDGQEYAKADYPELYAALGDTYGATTTNFKVPDYRGYFLRGWDHGAGNDPDAAGREDSGDGTTGDNVGTMQKNENKSHDHSFSTNPVGDHSHSAATRGTRTTNNDSQWNGYFGMADSYHAAFTLNGSANTNPAGGHSHSGTTNLDGRAETRPKNIYVMYIIKY